MLCLSRHRQRTDQVGRNQFAEGYTRDRRDQKGPTGADGQIQTSSGSARETAKRPAGYPEPIARWKAESIGRAVTHRAGTEEAARVAALAAGPSGRRG